MSKKKNKDSQIQIPDISSRRRVMNLDFLSSKSIGTVFNITNNRVSKSMYTSSKPPNNRNRYFIRKNSNIAISGVENNTLLVLKLIRKPLFIFFIKSFIKITVNNLSNFERKIRKINCKKPHEKLKKKIRK